MDNMKISQNKFAFFANFAETIRQLPEDKQAEAYKAICEYGIYGVLPEDILLKSICLIAQNSIYKNVGGAPEGNKNAQKKQPKTTQNNLETTSKQPMFQETETETESETRNKKQETETEDILISEDLSEEIKINSSDEPKYAFEGKIVKLNQKNFDEWKKAYPNLNLYAELLQRDRWLQKQPEDAHKNWFMSTSQYFIKQDALRKAQNSELAEQYGQSKASNDDWSHF